jgi:hypothetical protein
MRRPVAVSVEMKRAALDRIANGEAVSVVAADLGIYRQRLYDWQTRVRQSGLNVLRGPGRPLKPVLHHRLRPRRNAVFMAAVQQLVARLARTAVEPPVDSRCPSPARDLEAEPRDRRSKPTEASANCGNALVGESVEKWASDGGPCLPSAIAPIAAMSRPCESIACRLAGRTSKSDSETGATVRIRSATKRESGALIRADVASRACGERTDHRYGDAVRTTEPRMVRNEWASTATPRDGPFAVSRTTRHGLSRD